MEAVKRLWTLDQGQRIFRVRKTRAEQTRVLRDRRGIIKGYATVPPVFAVSFLPCLPGDPCSTFFGNSVAGAFHRAACALWLHQKNRDS